MPKKRKLQEINASSMADIAFLLLIFFLVTTEINIDEGITVSLPPWSTEPPPPVEANDRNTLVVMVNSRDQLLVEEELFEVRNLREYTKKFIDNHGRRAGMSDSPQKAIVSFRGDRGTSYDMYMTVYNELLGAYRELRDSESAKRYGMTYQEVYDDPDTAKRESIKRVYPLRLSEAEPFDFSSN